jgi:uncharacterized OsmC-like protein
MTDENTDTGHRRVTLTRTGFAEFDATNERGGTIHLGGEGADFRPVELLLAAMAGCSAIDVDYMTSRHAEPAEFEVVSVGQKVRDADGNHMTGLEVTFRVVFPAGEGGDTARERLPRAIAKSHDLLCSVSRTIQLGSPVTMTQA